MTDDNSPPIATSDAPQSPKVVKTAANTIAKPKPTTVRKLPEKAHGNSPETKPDFPGNSSGNPSGKSNPAPEKDTIADALSVFGWDV